jgi:hypothetical protein
MQTMFARLLPPALRWMLRAQAQAKLRRMVRRFCSRRRLVLSTVALVLAVVWLGNAAASILLREAYPLETLQKWVPLSLIAYSLWHFVKVAWKRPEAPIEWGPAEEELVCGGPFTRRQVLAYRLATVLRATVLKALCVSLLLLADLPVWPAGFVGIVLALAFLELVRMALEIAAHGASPRAYLLFRIGVFGVVGAAATWACVTAIRAPAPFDPSTSLATTELLGRILQAATEFRHTWLGTIGAAPFAPFGHVITAPRVFSFEFVVWLLGASALVAAMAGLVFWLDRACRSAARSAERATYQPIDWPGEFATAASGRHDTKLPWVPRLGGVGPIAWRQVVGAFGHRFGLVTAFVPPAVLALLPLAVPLGPWATFLQVIGGLVFYSFLLLPAALKFDFRRDYDRLGTFKTLPVSPRAVVVGQIATPVLLTSVFQLVVLAVTASFRAVPPGLFFSALALLVPLNVVIYSLENLLFLLSPSRPSQEGIDVFLRSILVFTAKGVLFAGGLLLLLLGSRAAGYTVHVSHDYLGVTVRFGVVFTVGVFGFVALAALTAGSLLVRAYRLFDPSLDGDR